MSIERSLTCTTITYGDRDTLTKWNWGDRIARICIAPLPPNHGLEFNKATFKETTDSLVPDGTAVILYFLNRECLTGFIDGLIGIRDRAFPLLGGQDDQVKTVDGDSSHKEGGN